MATFNLRRHITPLIHVLVWGLFGLTLILLNPLLGRITVPPQFWVKQAVVFGLWVAAFYFTARVSVPNLLFRGHSGRFVVVLLITAAVVVILSQLLEAALNLRALLDQAFAAKKAAEGWRPSYRAGGESLFRVDMKGMLTILLVLGISTAVSVVRKWQHDDQRRQELEQQKVTSELSYLKAQINPHFFFNTLNNIYALTVIDGEKAGQALHTLSRMMRYVLYETPAGTTPLRKELDFVQDYVTLMQLRLSDKVAVTFERPASGQEELAVAPMLLLPFVENAFKHGVDAGQPSFVYIAVRQPGPHTVELDVRNSFFGPELGGGAEGPGIGLANTRRRLELLYPGSYRLQVGEQPGTGTFRVHLLLHV
ncbi:sensor histidine kinase [Hymenobacter sp. BT175]|uniref:sensor histidine kinase n=1 Tax=Hymenobacter translucens TaxID=2886507 RepID=UPI001D0DCA4B|nr:sensor histidine kinase [Hymenobacter translucens]MCC2546769.1 sensor histidine kinase [Hymenobacter translucens]